MGRKRKFDFTIFSPTSQGTPRFVQGKPGETGAVRIIDNIGKLPALPAAAIPIGQKIPPT
jgi:hypothetical protein